mgnify:CR=1 FL=1
MFDDRSLRLLVEVMGEDRVMLGSVPGAMGAPQLASILQQVRDLDMEAVRAETAAQSGD